jgi:LPS-assembly protein
MKQTYSVFDFARGACIAFLLAPSATSAQAPLVFADESTCPADLIKVPDNLIPYLEMDATRMPINLEADSIDLPSSDELELRGNAFATQGARAIYADEILFNKKTMSLQAQNATLFSEQGDLITAAELDLEIETRIGSASMVTLQLSRRDAIPMRKVQDFSSMTYDRSGFTVASAGSVGSVKGPRMTTASPNEIRLSSGEALSLSSTEEVSLDDAPAEAPKVRAKARATAERLFLEGHDRERLQDVVYTRCVAGDDSVLVEAKEITLDHASGVGVGEHLKVRFYGVPIAYAPRMSFPINEERKSGLLFPTVGFGDNWGFNLEVPYYWNIAPARDATFSARYMAKRGLLGSGEFRYMGETGFGDYNGMLRGEWMPDDAEYDDSRQGFSYRHRQNVERRGSRLSFNANVGYVSDRDYLTDLSNNLEVSSASHLPQSVDVSVNPSDIFLENENFQINADVTAYQTIDKAVSKENEPYSRLPGLRVTWDKGFFLGARNTLSYNETRLALKPEFKSELINFDHASSSKTTGLRWDTETTLAAPIERTFLELTPKFTYAYTAYDVENQPVDDPSNPTRGIYLFELASKLFLERDVDWRSEEHTQTLVPSLTYRYVPYEDQDGLPVFDSGTVGFDNIADAFLGGGFWGSDRIQNFQGFILGLSSETYQSSTGDDLLRWSLAQQIYLAAREVTLESAGADSSDFSPLVGDIRFNLTRNVRTDGFINWNWDANQVDHWRLGASFDRDIRRRLSTSYSWYDTSDSLQLDFTWPIASRWQLGATALRSDSDGSEPGYYSKVTVGYDACCWAIQLGYEDRSDGSDQKSQSKFMATFSLRGLGRVSSDQLAGGFTTSVPSLN